MVSTRMMLSDVCSRASSSNVKSPSEPCPVQESSPRAQSAVMSSLLPISVSCLGLIVSEEGDGVDLAAFAAADEAELLRGGRLH